MPKDIFVDKDDNVVGSGDRRDAAKLGFAVRIIRIFLFNAKGELLLQKRSVNVRLPGLWDQSVGGHVDEGEDYQTAALREMKEELGVEGVQLTEVTKLYRESSDPTNPSRRFEMLYTGAYDGEVAFDAHEISEVRWIQPKELKAWMKEKPEEFTKGFILALEYLKLN